MKMVMVRPMMQQNQWRNFDISKPIKIGSIRTMLFDYFYTKKNICINNKNNNISKNNNDNNSSNHICNVISLEDPICS